MPVYANADEKPHPGCFNVKEASEITGYTIRQILRAINEGKLLATKHVWRYGIIQRRAYFITRDELSRWVAHRAVDKVARII
jgi:hypothetical protein